MCWPKAARASAKSAACAAANSRPSGSACTKSSSKTSPATSAWKNSAARATAAGRAVAALVHTTVDAAGQLTFRLDRAKLRTVRQREGRYLLRTNLSADNPELLWRCYMQLVFVEEAFRTLKGDLGLRPIYHHKADRIEAHLFVAFLAYCLSITLRQRLKALAGGLMPRVVFEKLATLQLLDVRVPTTDGRELLLVRRTEPDRDVALLLARLNLPLPPQPPPRISRCQSQLSGGNVVATFAAPPRQNPSKITPAILIPAPVAEVGLNVCYENYGLFFMAWHWVC